ncbi:ParB/RepB/Spo0J family partition protein [Siccirubricoccus sp. KC 17139]|uniref:ParB/RepB/Spo0J family partition protein n=1 Tax=Siccirubricoccus soli TaxID=2899147 RepID=A0ABT1D064_9PROT|nr:ParB/RepB/Spo0J family partition protein [Siccirubricoccus soli]MCO6415293.1 ParB/RepB/Spo0J family partition protein [Siccirubricoccus soli]MCP2681424.1 ParB/RepB/Spo0J family partition protein [Siccirubricoccus soli]
MKPPRLGRGLSALIGEMPSTPATDAGEALRTLPIEKLEPGPFQPRGPIDPAPLQELADSIREHGVLQPILAREHPERPGHYQIIGGERRWRAAQLVPLHEVPVVVRPLGDREAMAAALVENLQRQDLNALEEAEGYRRLIDEFGLTQDTLGKAVGKSRSHVANTLRLLGLPDRVRELLRDGALTAGHARALLTAPDPVGLALQVVDRGLNVRQAEALAATKPRDPGPERGAPRAEPEVLALERDLSERLGLRIAIRQSGKGGQVTIAYRDLDQLDGLIRLLQGG